MRWERTSGRREDEERQGEKGKLGILESIQRAAVATTVPFMRLPDI